MPDDRSARAERRAPPALNAETLDALAHRYVARYATTTAKLLGYLRRKLAARGWADDAPPDPAAVVQRCIEAGYVDDRAFAEMKSASLTRRGYGGRRIGQALAHAGIDRTIAAEVAPDAQAARDAAERYAQRKRIGRYGPVADADAARRQFAAMLRAGHGFDIAREILNERREIDAPSDDPGEQNITEFGIS